jgi:multimeric flavodoxin WrbA
LKNFLVLYHSQSGNTDSLAKSICKGISSQNETEIRCKKALESGIKDLLWCDAVLFGTPENFGFMSGALKHFFDQTYYPAKECGISMIPYTIFISCENNGMGAVHQIDQIAAGYPLKKSLSPFIVRGKIEKIHLNQAFEFGQTMAVGVIDGIF